MTSGCNVQRSIYKEAPAKTNAKQNVDLMITQRIDKKMVVHSPSPRPRPEARDSIPQPHRAHNASVHAHLVIQVYILNSMYTNMTLFNASITKQPNRKDQPINIPENHETEYKYKPHSPSQTSITISKLIPKLRFPAVPSFLHEISDSRDNPARSRIRRYRGRISEPRSRRCETLLIAERELHACFRYFASFSTVFEGFREGLVVVCGIVPI